MSDSDEKVLDAFGAWLRALGRDAELLGSLLASDELDDGARRAAAGGLNYLFKSLDLIPDGIDDIGYLDDAFVLRVAAAQAVAVSANVGKEAAQLAAENDVVKQFLGETYSRLDTYVTGLRTGAARGRTVQDILGSADVLEEFLEDVKGFAASYRAPSFSRDPKNLIKLRAFFDAKLPK
ncbi:MAG TPA: YkvA family protein [Polyangiales bacterium]|nr:YkvA family protein [Polyangiales bacterium]